jgi:hypothetical protein
LWEREKIEECAIHTVPETVLTIYTIYITK